MKSAKKNQTLLAAIDNEIANSLTAGHAEPAIPRRGNQPAHYLSILAVSKTAATSKTLKVRVVKDAGARTKNEAALNDVLY